MVLFCCWSVAQSCLTLLQPHGLQHARPLCPSPSPRVCPSSCQLHWWYHPAISSSDTLFSCFQSFLASDFSNESAVCIRWPIYWGGIPIFNNSTAKISVYWIDNLFIYLLQMLYMLSWLIFWYGDWSSINLLKSSSVLWLCKALFFFHLFLLVGG